VTPTTHRAVLVDVLGDVAGLVVLDVGCGSGELVRWFRTLGATAIGAECGAEMRRRALAADPDHADDYVDAPGEALPFPDDSIDMMVYSYSLHHVPVPDEALAEAHRVLRAGGTLVVIEPEVEPPHRAIAPEVVDEAEERAAAQRAIDTAERHGFTLERRSQYATESRYSGFEAWEDGIVGVDPTRAAAMELHRHRARAAFERIAARDGDDRVLRRTNLLAVLRA
jgi:SAM-dependent methyltransferase